ncbi:MAG: hypothetical protein AAF065_14675 [Verrucomicrobiota bacterium]
MKVYFEVVVRVYFITGIFLICGLILGAPEVATLDFEYVFDGDQVSEDEVVSAINTSATTMNLGGLSIFSFQEQNRNYITFAVPLEQYENLKDSVDLDWIKESMFKQGINSVEFRNVKPIGQKTFSLESKKVDFLPDFTISIIRPFRDDFENELETFLIGYIQKDQYSFGLMRSDCCICISIKDLDDPSEFLTEFDFGNMISHRETAYVYVHE